MKMLHRTRLAVAVLALGGLSAGSAAHADPLTARVVGGVVGALITSSVMKIGAKKASCRLYDRDGREVYLPCDPKRPLGEVMIEGEGQVMADGLAGGPPAAMDDAPLDVPAQHMAQYDAGPNDYAGAPPARYAPVEADCGCDHPFRGEHGRPVASFLSAQGGHAQTSYGPGRVVGVYDAYEQSTSSSAVGYSESYDGGYGYADGRSGGFYPYGGVGYSAGGYADYDQGVARVAGRDRDGFLTWAGKPVR